MLTAMGHISGQHYHILFFQCSACWSEGGRGGKLRFKSPKSSKTWELSKDALWGHWMSLGPGRGFGLCCRWNSSILSSEFRWRLVGWDKGIPSWWYLVLLCTNSLMMQFLLLLLASWKLNMKIILLFCVAFPCYGQCGWILICRSLIREFKCVLTGM